jgi:hypothetical protein
MDTGGARIHQGIRSSLYATAEGRSQRLASLSGHGAWVQTGSCGVDSELNETFTRTGD